MNKNGSKWCWPITRLAIYIRDNFTCLYCGRNLRHEKPRQVTLDHVIPRIKGGSNQVNNLVTACRACNERKNNSDLTDFADGDAIERVQAASLTPINRELARAVRR